MNGMETGGRGDRLEGGPKWWGEKKGNATREEKRGKISEFLFGVKKGLLYKVGEDRWCSYFFTW